MLNKTVITLLLACCLALVNFPVVAQDEKPRVLPDHVPGLLRTANEAYAAQDFETFRDAMLALTQKRPYNSDYMYQLVIAYALLDDKSKAYDLMLRMQQQGLSYDFNLSDDTVNIRDTQVYGYVNDLMRKAGEPMGESESVFTLPDSVVMPETISWDESRKQFLVGTVADGSILAVGMDGELEELLKANDENGLWAILDIKVDQANNRLWVSSASIPAFTRFSPVDKGRSALFEFELDSLKLVNRYPVPVDGQAHIFGSMILAPNGDVYVVDRSLPLIYRKSAAEQKIVPVMALKSMVSLRGVAMQADGRLMYVADREMGIAVVDVTTGRAGMLKTPPSLNIGGIDGMYLKDNRLIVIQNGIKPQRVMSLQLDSSGTQVVEVAPVAVGQAGFEYPNYGTVQSEYLYYFANSHWAGNPEPYKAVTVLRTSLSAAQQLVKPDMGLYLEEQARLEAEKLEAQKETEEKN